MKKLCRRTILVIAGCFVMLAPHAAQAQNTYSYSTISYDADSNTINSYAETTPDYNSQVYYGSPNVQSKIFDAVGNQLALQSTNTGSLSVDVSGNGSTSYKVVTGHWISALYSQYYSYSPCNGQFYYSSYNDYYNYQHFIPTPSTPNTFGFYLFYGPGPQCYQYTPNTVLGQSTATATVDELPPVIFQDATLGSTTVDFTNVAGVQYANLDATQSGLTICGHSLAGFTFDVTFLLPDGTVAIMPAPASTARAFGDTNTAHYRVTSTQLTTNLSSTPKSGLMDIGAFIRTEGAAQPPYNAIKVTVSGRYGSGTTFKGVGTVRIACP